MLQAKMVGSSDGAFRASARRLSRNWSRGAACSAISLLLLALAAPAVAQEKPIEIGVLALGPRPVPEWRCGPGSYQLASTERRSETKPFYVIGLLDELEKLKYVEDRPENAGKAGRRFVLDLRMGTLAQVKKYAKELAQKHVDMIVAVASVAVQVAQEETRNSGIPIIMTAVSDPIGDGFVRSLGQPGGSITGVSHQLVQGSAKRVELFKEMVPGLRRLIAIRLPGYRPSENSLADIRPVAKELQIELVDWHVTSREELQNVLAKADWQPGDGIMILPDSLVIANVDLVVETSLERRIPAFGLQDFMADWGAVAAYGPSAYEAGARDALYVDKISKGAKPGDLAIEPVDPIFVVNLKAAQCLGLSLPLEVLHQADRVIR